MAKRRKRPEGIFEAEIKSLSHEGRGITQIEGKTVFIDGALPGETVRFEYRRCHRRYDEAKTVEVLQPSPKRQEAFCEAFGTCGGCSLQHLSPEAQREHKASVLLEQFQHFGQVEPESWLEPVVSKPQGYRRKARLAVKHVLKKGGVLVGFRERDPRYVTQMSQCPVLSHDMGELIEPLKSLVGSLSIPAQIPQIEIAAGDNEKALVVRHLAEFDAADIEQLKAFAQKYELRLYLQPKGNDTVWRLWPEQGSDDLNYALTDFDLSLDFHPMDFTQVNAEINQKMVALSMELLAPQQNDKVLDLFCGLGNFSLPLAKLSDEVAGFEFSEAMVKKAAKNAAKNQLFNAHFYEADLSEGVSKVEASLGSSIQDFNKMLIDPPRSGAEAIVQQIEAFSGLKRLLYVSCNPATLARDSGILVKEKGFRLLKSGILDMFPNTTHVESIALFERE